MLNSCGHALSQGDGSDFHPRCNCEATPPGYSTCGRTWRRLAPCHGATPAQTYYANPVKLEKNMGMLVGATDCRRSWTWGCRGRWVLGFKPRHGSHMRGRTTQLWQRRGKGPCDFGGVRGENHAALAEWGPWVATQLMVPGA